ncbi:potassium channel family protein [Anaerocolumna sp. MB42-C2]|uniref:potassium channel family protein n=1 Tax=Anaerocolumna sp. MB42-C2 TaxID=3070997 RepID=UPI0027E10941|nr:TrkA family potassium uptake protein [Anaerocolumna sp. MB42-C2]WMJ90424.1 TrkA family potassium uptake protein [Anaerocolumna sp. MB42-C2]
MYIIIIGCGRLGSNLAKELSDDGNDICVIDRDGDKLNTLGSGFNGRRIKGIEFDSDKLLEAGIKKADALIAASPDDNINITVSLIADKIYTVPKIIARINDPDKSYFYNKLGISTINPIQYEIEILKSQLPSESLDIISTLDNNYGIIELLVGKEKDITVVNIEDKFHCIISGLMKDGAVSLPKKDDRINKGDRIYCTVHKNDKEKLINYLCKEIFL